MYASGRYYVCMKRTTIELDQDLVRRAREALGTPTTRATVEEALRRVVEANDRVFEERRRLQLEFFRELPNMCDIDVLRSDEMWR